MPKGELYKGPVIDIESVSTHKALRCSLCGESDWTYRDPHCGSSPRDSDRAHKDIEVVIPEAPIEAVKCECPPGVVKSWSLVCQWCKGYGSDFDATYPSEPIKQVDAARVTSADADLAFYFPHTVYRNPDAPPLPPVSLESLAETVKQFPKPPPDPGFVWGMQQATKEIANYLRKQGAVTLAERVERYEYIR